MRKNNVAVPEDESKMCPLEVYYDADVHDALANLRRLDGDIPVHPQYGMSVIFLPPKNRASTGPTTGPSPLLRKWGTSIRTFCIILIMVIIFIIGIH